MLKSLIAITFRNLVKNKAYSLINIIGLSLGLSTCFVIVSFVRYELSFDNFHVNKDRIFRVVPKVENNGQYYDQVLTNTAIAIRLKENFAEVESAVRFGPFQTPDILEFEDEYLSTDGFYLADPEVFDIFSIELIKGSPKEALAEPYNLVISASMAQAAFGDIDPIGKVLIGDNEDEFTVTGVFNDLPKNSHLKVEYMLAFSTLVSFRNNPDVLDNYDRTNYYTYLLTKGDADPEQLSQQFSKYYKTVKSKENNFIDFYFQPLEDVHLSKNIRYDFVTGDKNYILAFSAVALLILLTACFNFMNLSTARALRRAREVGVRKTLGALRSQLIMQYLGESIIITAISLIIGGLLTEILVPIFNNVSGSTININFIGDLELLMIFAIIGMVTALVAGWYPAFYLSSFNPTRAIKNNSMDAGETNLLRKVLIVFQFLIASVLLIIVLSVDSQLEFMQNADLGFKKENVLMVGINSQLRKNYQVFKNELLDESDIGSMTQASTLPGQSYWTNTYYYDSESGRLKEQSYLLETDPDYFTTLDIQIVDGRNFDWNNVGSKTVEFMVNEAAVKKFGWKNPVGEKFYNQDKPIGTVVGVVKDFNFKSLHNNVEPLIIDMQFQYANVIGLKIVSDDISETMTKIERVYNKVSPDFPFDYRFLDQHYDRQYRSDLKLGKLLKSFSVISIFIAVIGLLGLVSFSTERKRKEIGIRKVLGAKVSDIIWLLSTEFNKTILVGLFLSVPIAYYLTNIWLSNFAYKSVDYIKVILTSSILLILLSLITLSFQSIKAALSNPVDTLKEE
ncbi:MAG: ABC transporter permease [Ignavibacteria bacterium]|nr:ABC transporter permease [Ignavibacteria bacterium]